MPKPVYGVPSSHATVHAQKTASGVTILEKHEAEELALPDMEAVIHPAYQKVSLGLTKNMENYESLRLDVSITSPCANTPDAKVEAATKDMQLAMKILAKEFEAMQKAWF